MSFLSRLFKNKESLLHPADISRLEVDMHSHFLPGIDDGAANMEDSLAMLRRMSELGYRKVITTPHVMSDFYKNTPNIIKAGLDNVREAAQKEGIALEIEASAEYYLDDQLEGLIERKEVLPFGNNHILFELPFIAEPQNLARAVFNMQLGGYKPILAHPERYTYWHGSFEKYEETHEKGVLLQVNINALSGYYGPQIKQIADRLVEKDMVSFLGTDCHRLDHLEAFEQVSRRMPSFHKLLESGHLLNPTL